jgi:hypothetical protein
MTVGEITGIIGACATVVTVFLVPIARAIKSHQKEKAKEKEKQRKRDEKLDAIYNKMSTIDTNQQELNNIKTQFDSFLVDYDEFTTQNLKYMINDAFFGYENIHEIPNDVLTNACECCEIYVNKRHKNHEIRPRCELLWREQERRSVEREGSNE